MSRRRTWEHVVLLPGRVVTLPLAALGALTSTALERAEAADLLKTAPSQAGDSTHAGFEPGIARFGDRSGVGPALGYGVPVSSTWRLTARAEATTSAYAAGHVALAGGPVSLRATTSWRPRDRFYGIGMSGDDRRASNWALAQDAVDVRLESPRAPGAIPRAPAWSMWAGGRRTRLARGRDDDVARFEEQYPQLAAAWSSRAIADAIAGAGADLDRRTGALRWTSGWRLAGTIERHAGAAHALAPSGAEPGPAYTRWTALAEAGASVMRDPRTLRVRLAVADTRPDRATAPLPPYDLVRLGGSDGLAGFHAGRFRDLALVLGRVSWVFPLSRRFEIDAHSEWGAVAPALGAARASALRNSVGVSVRGRTNTSTFGAIGIDRSAESVRLNWTLGIVP